jgi:hypothetical protein
MQPAKIPTAECPKTPEVKLFIMQQDKKMMARAVVCGKEPSLMARLSARVLVKQ